MSFDVSEGLIEWGGGLILEFGLEGMGLLGSFNREGAK